MSKLTWQNVLKDGVRFHRAVNLHESGIVAHGFSTRIGGTSVGPYDSLNLGLAVQDDQQAVISNRRKFAAAIGVDFDRIIVPQQVHKGNVVCVHSSDAGLGAQDHSDSIPDTDALITNIPGLTLALHFADCTSIFLFDPVRRAIGVAHAGWRGTECKIVANTIDAMIAEFATDPADLLAAIGPCICSSCYEVGEEVASALSTAYGGDESVIISTSDGKLHADLKRANYLLLRHYGVKDGDIAVSKDCTSCNSEEFYSYRRSGLTGRMGGWMSLL